MSGISDRTIALLFIAFVVTGSGLAQDKPARKKLKLAPAQPKLQVQLEIKDFALRAGQPVMFQNAVIRLQPAIGGLRLVTVPSNPLMKGEYKTALQVFDRLRTGLSMPKDARTARGLLDDLDLKLIAVRRALWKAERRAKAGKPPRRVVFHPLTVSPHVAIEALTFQRLVFGGRRFNAGKLIQVEGKWVVDDGTNPFLRGAYRNAVVALTKTRNSLSSVGDPKAARRIVDTLDRMLLDVRRELWKIEQAQKK